ncbi:Hypothetical predicted protein [Mytilus galloprovincialis]|uniref:B box-type domain-containing protein n=1 Tax=Mytilus galloprovincialis TaxID=29158 RepID=A0A8B6EPI7_MYTGA|nr:Hypothetical predicted protein [Mytilus galloprovincialis]
MEKSIKAATLKKEQVLVSCHVSNGPGAKWKCKEFDVFMCRACKEKGHGKLKYSQSHEVATINDIQDTLADSTEVWSEIITWVLNSYTTSVPTDSFLSCSIDDIVYIFYNVKLTECVFIKGKILKASLKVLQTYPLPMFNFTLNRNSEVIFTNISSEKKSPVRMISSSDEIRIVMDPKPMLLTALHVNKDNELLYGQATGGYITERLKFSYRGPPRLGVFCPHSFAITPIDNIVLLDNLNNALHVLNSKGILLALQSLVKLNIVIASALCIDNEELLLIGCRGVDGQTGKIHVVKIADRFM